VLGQDGPASSLSRRGRPGPNRSEQDATASASAAPACSTIVAAIAGSSIGSALVRCTRQAAFAFDGREAQLLAQVVEDPSWR